MTAPEVLAELDRAIAEADARLRGLPRSASGPPRPASGWIAALDIRLIFAYALAMLTDKEAEEIRLGVRSGLRGPVLSKWIEALLRDRDERVELERKLEAGRDASPGRGATGR